MKRIRDLIMIKIENVTKRYGNFVAVDNISLEVNAGEIFGFLGVNGAGKTTTLRMLAGILKPSAGKITLGGFDIEEDPTQAKQITGFIPDRPYIYNKLTGREFLYFCADLYSINSKTAESKIDQLLEEYALTEWQDELVESYSHGMKQRLATCSALVHEPKILVVDEPIVGLDPHGAKMLKDSLRKYAKAGMAIMLSTHSLNVAEEISDRLAIIHRGSILTSGSLSEIREISGSHDQDLENVFIKLTSNIP